MANLRSDASKTTWGVKVEDGGQKLTDGWKEFALAHDLRVGDILIFRQEKDMAFHVTLLGPSCCEIQYESCLDDKNKLGKIPKKKKVKKNPRKEAKSCLLDPSCFVANVTPSSLRHDTLNLPRSFVRANGLDTRCGEIVVMNEKGRSWTLALKQKNSCQATYIRGGWRSFFLANGLSAGDSFTFKLIQGGPSLVLRLSTKEETLSTESDSDEENKHDEKRFKKRRLTWRASSSPSQNRFVTLTLTPSSLKNSTLFLPARFTRMHDISEETKMSLLDKHGVKWSTNLRCEKRGDRIRMVSGWKDFFKANYVKTGESVMLKLIWEGETRCVLKFCSKVKQESSEGDEVETLSTESETDEEGNLESSYEICESKWYTHMMWRDCSDERRRVKAGDFFTFKLIKRGETLVLRKSFSPTGSEEEEEEDCSSEGDTRQDEETKKKKYQKSNKNGLKSS
ncbi:unnamed protein product [Microthlaspi erraticum]|uniref:TF-B3 domain-containing protein n=1 Tax=Microthlaspi erraticum TaxID=1685480 RepID=A0A6D2KNJ6_9BRAS|nr:unnamed protein product [Microthlaspi erraticum]